MHFVYTSMNKCFSLYAFFVCTLTASSLLLMLLFKSAPPLSEGLQMLNMPQVLCTLTVSAVKVFICLYNIQLLAISVGFK